MGEPRDPQARHRDVGDGAERYRDHSRDRCRRTRRSPPAPSARSSMLARQRSDLGATVVERADAREVPDVRDAARRRLEPRNPTPRRRQAECHHCRYRYRAAMRPRRRAPPRRCCSHPDAAPDRADCAPRRTARCHPGPRSSRSRSHPRRRRRFTTVAVLLGAPVTIGNAPARARKALNVDPVLDRHRDTVQRTEDDVSPPTRASAAPASTRTRSSSDQATPPMVRRASPSRPR